MPITRNEVITAGEMLRPRRDHYGNTRFTLLVSRYDMDTVYVPVFCRIRIPENIKSHDRILVKGSLISFRERIGEGQYSPVLEIDAHEITKQEETVMERVFGKAGHVPDRPFFNAYLTGTIDYISEAPRDGRSGARGLFRRLQIQVDQEKRDRLPQYVPLQYFDDGRRLPHLDSFNLMRGDTVNVWVTLSTPTRISDERGEQRFRDLNVEDLILEKRAGNEEETARAARVARRAERERERNARRLEERAAREASATVGELDDVYPPTKEEAKIIRAKVESKKRYLVKLLKEQGKYTAELSIQATVTAQLLVRTEILAEEILAEGHEAINVELSREGNERKSISPKEKLYLDFVEKSQKALRALGMNTDSKDRKTDGDDFKKFMEDFSDDNDD